MSTKNTTQSQLSKLAAFRQSIYGCLTKARDALFELIDAILTTPQLASFPELSCAPVFRRQWPSLYEAVQDGALDRQELLKLEVENLPTDRRPLLVGDHTAWSRPQARTLRDRTFEHQPTPIRGQKPITIGHGYSTLGVVPETEGSWFLPLLHERINSDTTPSTKMAAQLKEVCPLLPERPLGLFDAEYGSGVFVKETDGIDCDLLFRIRPNRKLRLAPGPYKGRGPHPKHGAIFRLSDPTTWPTPSEEWEFEDEKFGPMRIKRWDNLHFEDAPNLHFEDAPNRPITLLRVERLKARKTRRDPGVIWLGYCGQEKLPLKSALWRQYLSRYVVEHWYRFINQSLHWKAPHFSTPEQSELWSTLIVIASWQLWLARCGAKDNPRPWQKPQLPEKMTPGRVHQAMGGILAGIGTPASAPKTRGNSPGWPVGRIRAKRARCEVVKKRPKETNDVKKVAPAQSQASP